MSTAEEIRQSIGTITGEEYSPIKEDSPMHTALGSRKQCDCEHVCCLDHQPGSCANSPKVKVFFELWGMAANLCGPCMVANTQELALVDRKIVERFA